MRTHRVTKTMAVLAAASLALAACGGDDSDNADDAPEEATDDTSADTGDEEADAGDEDADTGDESSDEEAAEPVDDVTVTVWSWRTEDEDAYNQIFDVYEEQNPGVTVEFVPFVNTDYNNILSTGLTGDGGPDVVQLRAYGGVQPLIEAGQLMPLDGEIETLTNFTDDILQGATGQSDGRVYGVPFGVQAFTAFYNVAIFDELGLSEPTTWDEWISTLDTLAEAGYIPISAPAKDVWMLPIIHDALASSRYGGNEFVEELLAGETDFTDPDYVASLQVVADHQQYMPDDVVGVSYNDARTFFIAEQAGIFLGGSFEIGFWNSEAPDMEIGAFTVPATPDAIAPAAVPGWMDGSYGVNANTDAPEAALNLVEWMGTPEFGQMFSDEIKQISPVAGVTPNDPLLGEFSEMFNESPVPYLHLVHFRYGEPLGSDLDAAGIQAMFLGDATPEQVATDIQEGVSQWFTPGS